MVSLYYQLCNKHHSTNALNLCSLIRVNAKKSAHNVLVTSAITPSQCC